MKTIDFRSEKGSILVMTSILSFSLFLMGLGFLKSVNTYQKHISTEITILQSFYAAKAKLTLTKVEITKGNISGNQSSPWSEWNRYGDDNVSWRYSVEYASSSNEMYGTARGYRVNGQGKATFFGSQNEYEYSMWQTHIQETFADYLYLSDIEEDPVRGDSIRFWTPDTLDGKVHSNDTIRIHTTFDRPHFKKRVTTVAPYITPINNNATFDEGYFGNAAAIHFPDQADEIRQYSFLREFGTFAPDSVDSSTEITFDGDMFYVRYCGFDSALSYVCSPANIAMGDQYQIPATGALFVHGKLYIKAARGTPDVMDPTFISSGFSGRLTVASSDTMIIPDNLIYTESNPNNTVPDNIAVCPSVLGLISENFIMIGKDCNQTVYINAAMAAIRGSITVQDIYAYHLPNNMKESLFIHGSLAQKNRGIVRTTHLNHRAGFDQKDYNYDKRLQKYPPPHFLSTRANEEIYYERLM